MRCVVVILTCVFLALSPPGEGCRSGEYEPAPGMCCPLCDKGSVVLRDCTDESSTNCRPCESGTYMDADNGRSQCMSCRPCIAEQGLGTQRECSRVRDSACSVLDGFYCQASNQESGCSLAEMHTRCAAGQTAAEPGTRTTDTVCEDCATGFYSPEGANCTAWNICVDGEVELHEGSRTKDVLCAKAPGRHHYVIIIPVLVATGAVVWMLVYETPSSRHRSQMEDYHKPDQQTVQALANIATRLRINSIKATTAAGSGHPTSCSSVAEIMSVLFFNTMKYRPEDPKNIHNDRFVLSKGHAAPILYAVWAEAGYLKESELLNLRKVDSILEGHPVPVRTGNDITHGQEVPSRPPDVCCVVACADVLLSPAFFSVVYTCGDGHSPWRTIMSTLNHAAAEKGRLHSDYTHFTHRLHHVRSRRWMHGSLCVGVRRPHVLSCGGPRWLRTPLSFVEGAGFRSFMATVAPPLPRLSQRAVGLQLYEDVERKIKPQLIRDLQARLAGGEGADRRGAIHVTFDLWAGEIALALARLLLAALAPLAPLLLLLHPPRRGGAPWWWWRSCSCTSWTGGWRLRRSTVAFRQLAGGGRPGGRAGPGAGRRCCWGTASSRTPWATWWPAAPRRRLEANAVFGDYKVCHVLVAARLTPTPTTWRRSWGTRPGPPEGGGGTPPRSRSSRRGTAAACVASTLQLVIREALKNSRVVENVLTQLRCVVAFFRTSGYWNEPRLPEGIPAAGEVHGPSRGLTGRPHSVIPSQLVSASSPCRPPGHMGRWNSLMASMRRLVDPASWSSIMTLLAQARIEAQDSTSAPPLVRARREQLVDILGLLQPFEDAIQVLQKPGVTLSFVIPSLMGLDTVLAGRPTGYTHFSKALRAGLQSHLQPLILQRDLILATVLDPRIKLQPFPDAKQESEESFLTVPSKSRIQSMLETLLEDTEASASPAAPRPAPPGAPTLSELEGYLSEPLLEGDAPLLFWKAARRFPKLQSMARRLLAIPATSGGFPRLYPMAASIVKAKRSRLPPHTTERLLLFRESVRWKQGPPTGRKVPAVVAAAAVAAPRRDSGSYYCKVQRRMVRKTSE
ncbi:LOW QUALITY PROTEIN: uncharacterized protein LOC132464125 [Gadus macrocephalus]|uniref:LOW QUALITY PROTEIN: uncharacterized protein LOC132464125 n=1 Tax=Gadus macrocephalus TaxID=80720 RepID=UPI0028CB1509|nr:LOW QUALITY PROTEIN: uncharacterized protein LOC132464125 [Gadus macrocephalus]